MRLYAEERMGLIANQAEKQCKHRWIEMQYSDDMSDILKETPFGILYRDYQMDRCAKCGGERKKLWGLLTGRRRAYWVLKFKGPQV